MKRQPDGKGNKSVSTSNINRFENVQLNPISVRHSEAEIISQLKVLALDPCRPQFAHDTIQDLRNQILKLRKVMVLENSEAPWVRSLTFSPLSSVASLLRFPVPGFEPPYSGSRLRF
ncbi:hypothetical protein OROGR_024232 [Orobanche gracilis]